MDKNRFDNMTRLLGSGLNRRQVIRGLIGGAGALAGVSATQQLVGAACDPNADTVTCPEGSFHAGQTKKPDGGCCNGNGNCCSNQCSTDNICVSASTPGCVGDDDCTAPCTSCVGGTCTPYAEYCEAGDYCYEKMEGECCTDAECGNDFCIDRQCSPCPSGVKYCETTQTCYTPSTGECCPNTADGCETCNECVGNTCTAIAGCCTVDEDCTEPCTSCVGGTCTPYAKYCEATGQCYNPSTDGCCPGIDGCGDCWECNADSVCVHIEDCCTQDSDCTEHCTSCVGGTCTPYAEYCDADGGYCYNTQTGECCTDEECGDEVCTDRHCCPPGYEYCPDGDYCYTERTGGCCTDDQCGDGYCVDATCRECPSGQTYCEASKSCYDPATQCCTDSECGPCAYCSELNNTCFGECSQNQTCCYGECVDDAIGCCRHFGDYCGETEVASAGGDDRQYDCCDGLLCCFGQSTNVCGECCADFDCTAAPGGVCNKFQCDYPTCEGKYEACGSDSDCCYGLKCYGGVCKHHHHHPKPTPEAPVTTLPATGTGNDGNGSSGALGVTLATGAAALLAAKYLRQNSTEESSEDA